MCTGFQCTPAQRSQRVPEGVRRRRLPVRAGEEQPVPGGPLLLRRIAGVGAGRDALPRAEAEGSAVVAHTGGLQAPAVQQSPHTLGVSRQRADGGLQT